MAYGQGSWRRRGRFEPWLGKEYPAESKSVNELEALRAYAENLKQELKGLGARIKELTAASGED